MNYSLLNLNNLILFISFIINVVLGHYVLFQNRKSAVHRSFSIVAFLFAIWILCDYLTGKAVDPGRALFWGRAAFIGAAFTPAAFLYFILAFLRKVQFSPFTKFILLFVPGLLFMAASFTDLMITEARPDSSGVQLAYGPLYQLFLAYFVLYILYAFYSLALEYRASHGIKKAQISYLFLGAFLSGLVWSSANIILPALFNVTVLYKLGPFSAVIMISFAFYSIIRHRLMNIEFVIQRAIIYTILTLLIIATYSVIALVSERMLLQMPDYGFLIFIVIASVVISIAYQPILKALQDISDRVFFRRGYDYQRTLRDVSKALASVMRVNQLARYIVEVLIDTVKVNELSILLFDAAQKKYQSVQIEYKRPTAVYKKMTIDASSHIITYLKSRNSMLVADELDFMIEDAKIRAENKKEIDFQEELKSELDRLGMAVWVPIVSQNEMIGMIALGYKISGEMYAEEDLQLISILCNQVATALDNARLYEEVLTTKNYSDNILQSMTSGVVTTDLSGGIVTFNKAFERATGLDRLQIEGSDMARIFKDNRSVADAIKGTMSDKETKNIETSIARAGGDKVPVSLSSVILRDSAGKKTGYLYVMSDMSEMKTLEGRVRQADKLAAVGTMAAGMAHEIKNPLSSIKVFSQLMLKRYDDKEYRKKFIEIIPKEIARIDRIVESLLSFARVSQPNPKKCSVAALIEDILAEYSDEIKGGDIKVIKDIEEAPDIMADSDQIRQALSNLILNAIQAMGSGGELAVSVGNAKDAVSVRIADTGHGITKADMKKLFDPFFTTKHGGTGLGMSIAHSIIEAHKGTIDVGSEAGKGTTVTITLPLMI